MARIFVHAACSICALRISSRSRKRNSAELIFPEPTKLQSTHYLMVLHTIGYEGASMDEFLGHLDAHNIDTLIDVREYPLSRKAGFSKTKLSEFLKDRGVNYIHIKSLGCPKPIRSQYYEDANWNEYTKKFKSYLSTQVVAIEELLGVVQNRSCALMCFEADYNHCHRSIIAKSLEPKGVFTQHIVFKKG